MARVYRYKVRNKVNGQEVTVLAQNGLVAKKNACIAWGKSFHPYWSNIALEARKVAS